MINLIRTAQNITIKQNPNPAACGLHPLVEEENLSVFRFSLHHETEFVPKPIILEWKFPAVGVLGVWKPTADFSKRIEADWELKNHESRISIDAPVLALFGVDDENALCFSCSNAINRIEMGAKFREEDNTFYCQVVLFTECRYPIQDFSIDIRIDTRKIPFSEALRQTSSWWETYDNLKPAHVPEITKQPLYSTWYQFHQDLDEELLLEECRIAKKIGFEAIIIDDGWQTKDNNRGYDYTGDWRPEHFDDFGGLVRKIQDIGLKVGVWYSVPFCGKKSEAYKRFEGKFLTENHRWAPVLDPRFPEVREYLVNTYAQAAKNWNLDGFKLDFIDDFKSYPETNFELGDGKDLLSINAAVDVLLTQVHAELQKINPNIFIEFRQKYTGPAMRKYGNMLRAFDCPGDYIMNRVRIADIKLLAGNTAVHADMVTWNLQESVEVAARHYMNTLFGVPQISVMLTDIPEAHLQMIAFLTQYWKQNTATLLSKKFHPKSPSENYPVLYAEKEDKKIIGLFSDHMVTLTGSENAVDLLNARPNEKVVVLSEVSTTYSSISFDCCGNVVHESILELQKGCNLIALPKSGILQLSK